MTKKKPSPAEQYAATVPSAPLPDDVPLFAEQPTTKAKKPTRRAGRKITEQRRQQREAMRQEAEQPTQPATTSSAATGQRIGYVRVSSADQNTARQLADQQLDRVFTDKISGKDTQRPQLQIMLAYVREGDTVYVHSLDRLGRNLLDLQTIVNQLTEKGVNIHFIKENLIFNADKTSSMSQLLFNIMGAFAQFERSLILERQREGIKQAKLEGKYKGRKPKLTNEQVAELKERAKTENKTHLALQYGISRNALYTYLKS